MRQGLIHLYTGDGKGKTTSAFGLLLRAYGRGMRIVLVQFLKGHDTGELHALENLHDIIVLRNTGNHGFYRSADEVERMEIAKQNNANLTKAYRLTKERLCDLLVLDEICAAYNIGALDAELADKLIMEKPFELELVLTGRNAPPHFMKAADYITEFTKHKHPYDSGIAAREGIEF